MLDRLVMVMQDCLAVSVGFPAHREDDVGSQEFKGL